MAPTANVATASIVVEMIDSSFSIVSGETLGHRRGERADRVRKEGREDGDDGGQAIERGFDPQPLFQALEVEDQSVAHRRCPLHWMHTALPAAFRNRYPFATGFNRESGVAPIEALPFGPAVR
jgi:hypothetical protein